MRGFVARGETHEEGRRRCPDEGTGEHAGPRQPSTGVSAAVVALPERQDRPPTSGAAIDPLFFKHAATAATARALKAHAEHAPFVVDDARAVEQLSNLGFVIDSRRGVDCPLPIDGARAQRARTRRVGALRYHTQLVEAEAVHVLNAHQKNMKFASSDFDWASVESADVGRDMLTPRAVALQAGFFASMGLGAYALRRLMHEPLHPLLAAREASDRYPSLAASLSQLATLGDDEGLRRCLAFFDEIAELDASTRRLDAQWKISRASAELVREAKDMCERVHASASDDVFRAVLTCTDEVVPQLESHLETVLHNHLLARTA